MKTKEFLFKEFVKKLNVINDPDNYIFNQTCEILDSYSDFLDDYRLYDLDDDTINDMLENKEPVEIIQMCVNSKHFSWSDDYFRIDAYEHIETYPIKDYKKFFDWSEVGEAVVFIYNTISDELNIDVANACSWYLSELEKISELP